MVKGVVQPPGLGFVPPAAVQSEDHQALFRKVALDFLSKQRKVFDSLNAAEQAMVLRWFSEAVVDGNPENSLHTLLWELDHRFRPVSIDQFVTDPDYFGRTCAELDDKWRHDLRQVMNPDNRICEWVFTGAIGTGKTSVAVTVLGYKLYWLSSLRNPATYYGLLPDSLVVFGIYSITKRQVADTGYHKLKAFIDSSPYFRDVFPRSRKIDSKIVFEGRNIQVISGSTELHALGLDLWSFCLDEVNFMRARVDKETGKMAGQAYTLYDATRTRIKTRFVREGGMIPGLMLLMSSRSNQTAFLENHLRTITGGEYKIGLTGRIAENTYLSDYASWDIRSYRFAGHPTFRVEVGDRLSQSRVLAPDDKVRDGAKVIEVPDHFRSDFLEDVDQALRDVAGVATFNISPLIRDRASVRDAVRSHLKHPFTSECVTLTTDDDVTLQEYFNRKIALEVVLGKWTPKLNPGVSRCIHVDTSLTGDCTGLAMAHTSGVVRDNRMQPDGTYAVSSKPFVIVDFMLRLIPPASAEIPLWKIRDFILFLRQFYSIRLVTFDGWQSRDSAQLLRRERLQTGILSLDKRDDAYVSLRSALFDRRIAVYYYRWFENEVLDLERDVRRSKVDHPAKNTWDGGPGSKDMADAVCGAYYDCFLDESGLASLPEVDTVSSRRVVEPPKLSAPQQPLTGRTKIINTRKVSWEQLRASARG